MHQPDDIAARLLGRPYAGLDATTQRVAQHDAGDHVLFIGRVLALSETPLPPLLFQAGHYRMLGEVL